MPGRTTCSARRWPPAASATWPARRSWPRCAIDPRDPATYTNLALLELEGGNRAAGLQRLAEALTLDPASPAAREAFARERAKAPAR